MGKHRTNSEALHSAYLQQPLNEETVPQYSVKRRVTEEEVNEEKAKEGREKVSKLRTGLVALAIILGIGCAYHLADALDLGTKINNLFTNEKELDDDTNSVVIDDSEIVPTPVPTAKPIGGSFVDNHNQELYISGLEDIKEVDKGNVIDDGSKKTYTSSTGSNATYVNNGYINNGVQNNTYINNSGDMDITASQDNTVAPGSTVVNPTAAPVTPAPTAAPVVTPAPTATPTQAPTEEVKYEGYVLRKLNYSANGMWYTFYFTNDQICVNCDDIEMMDQNLMNPHNSNILVISDTPSKPGYEYVRDVTATDFVSLDSYDNIEAVINELLAEQNAILGLK